MIRSFTNIRFGIVVGIAGNAPLVKQDGEKSQDIVRMMLGWVSLDMAEASTSTTMARPFKAGNYTQLVISTLRP